MLPKATECEVIMKKIIVILVMIIYTLPLSIDVSAVNIGGDGKKNNLTQNTKAILYPFEQNGKWGYMDKKGNVIINNVYDTADNFSYGLALVGKVVKREKRLNVNTKQYYEWKEYAYGYIDETGKITIPIKYDYGTSFKNGNAVVSVFVGEGEYDYIHYWIKPNGKYFLKLTGYDFAQPFNDGLAMVEQDGYAPYFGYVDKKGNVIIELVYWKAESFSEELAVIRNHPKDYTEEFVSKAKAGYINIKNEMVIGKRFDHAGSFSEGLAPVCIGDKWGFIDKTGNYRIPLMYEDARPFSDGLAAVKQNGRWGFINKNNEVVIKPQYAMVDDCINGLMMVRNSKGNFSHYIDKNNNKILPKNG